MSAHYAAHPLADRFPMLPEDELDRLAADVAENGLRNPIILDADGRILDGRNRYAACDRAGVEPEFVTFEGDDEAAFVLSANVARRHMTTGQQAMSTALVLSDAGRRENGRWKRGSVAIGESSNSSAWRKQMDQAGQILDYAPELADDVVSGSIALDAAFRQAEQKRDAERLALAEQERIEAEEADARARLLDLAPHYLQRYDNARVAFTAWESDNRAAAARERQEKAAREAEEKRRRADLSLTYTSMANGLMSVGSYGNADIDTVMAGFEPSLLNPPQLIRYFDTAYLRAGVAFLNDLIAWKESA
jgi:hypothetical protein